MEVQAIADQAARQLGYNVDALEEQGQRIRAERRRGWLEEEVWTSPAGNDLRPLIDHTLLRPDATESDIVRLCQEATDQRLRAVCVNPVFVPVAAQCLAGTPVRVATVVGFPLGATTSLVKAVETTACIAGGATEIDMVICVGALKGGRLASVLSDLRAVVEAAGERAMVKVILENGFLTPAEIVTASYLCRWAGADYVKTATGFGPAGAQVDDVALMRRVVGSELGVKAAGGIRDRATALAMVAAGASRIGTSRGPALLE